MEMEFMPVDYDYFDFKSRNFVKITGRNADGERVCLVDTCEIYFWAVLKDGVEEDRLKRIVKKIGEIEFLSKRRIVRVEKVEVHNKKFLGKDVRALKIFGMNYKDLQEIAEQVVFDEIEKRRGYDLGFATHYIIEKDFVPMRWHKVKGKSVEDSKEFAGLGLHKGVDACFVVEEVREGEEKEFKPKILSYDIETDGFKIGEGEILMVSLVSEGFKKVITWKRAEVDGDYVEFVKDEAELIQRFVRCVKDVSPDFLVGYFSDGFDLPYLKARAEENGLRLGLGLDNSQPRFSGGATGIRKGKIKGLVHIDLIKFIQTAYSQYMQSETLSLNEVSKEFLGDTKKDFKIEHSSKLDESKMSDYIDYNLHDSILVYDLFKKFWDDLLEFTRVMQEPIFDVSRNGMSNNVEDFIIHNLKKFDEIPEKKPTHRDIRERRNMGKYEGAFVFEPIPNLYENISVFDFTSCYGSTIVTYNLSKSSLIESSKNSEDCHKIEVSGRKIFFSKESGFFPEMLKEIIEKRKKYKEELKDKPDVVKQARSNAFKLLANASYGYQGFFGARYYSREAAEGTTAFARQSIADAIEKIDGAGYKTIYSDTDSIAFLMKGRTETDVLEFLKSINEDLPGIMELELEGFFERGIWVTKRTGTIGAKKKYALLGKDGKLKIRGFETVRRDWCSLARHLQNEIIRLVLQDGNEKRAVEYLKEVIKKVRNREFSKKDLIIKTQLKKPISEYKAITPHVVAGKRMEAKGVLVSSGNLVEYYVAETENKKSLVRDRVRLADESGDYDIKYYLENQILPSVENIFHIFGIEVKEFIVGEQRSLSDF